MSAASAAPPQRSTSVQRARRGSDRRDPSATSRFFSSGFSPVNETRVFRADPAQESLADAGIRGLAFSRTREGSGGGRAISWGVAAGATGRRASRSRRQGGTRSPLRSWSLQQKENRPCRPLLDHFDRGS